MTRIFLSLLVFFFAAAPVKSTALAQTKLHPLEVIRKNPQDYRELRKLVTELAWKQFNPDQSISPTSAAALKEPLGVFVTVKKDGKILGCMGTLQPKAENLQEEISRNLTKAFQQDPRHPPMTSDQLPGSEIFISWVGNPRPVKNLGEINPFRDSILIARGNRRAVVLAGEAKTTRYLLALAKAKAGIKKGQDFHINRLTLKSLSVNIPADFNKLPN